MKAKYIQKGDAVDYIPNQDMDAGESVCLGDLIGITRIPIKAGTLGTLTLSGVFDIIKQAGVTFSTGDSVCWNSSSGSAAHTGVVLGLAIEKSSADSEHVRVLLNCNANSQKESSGADAEWLPL